MLLEERRLTSDDILRYGRSLSGRLRRASDPSGARPRSSGRRSNGGDQGFFGPLAGGAPERAARCCAASARAVRHGREPPPDRGAAGGARPRGRGASRPHGATPWRRLQRLEPAPPPPRRTSTATAVPIMSLRKLAPVAAPVPEPAGQVEPAAPSAGSPPPLPRRRLPERRARSASSSTAQRFPALAVARPQPLARGGAGRARADRGPRARDRAGARRPGQAPRQQPVPRRPRRASARPRRSRAASRTGSPASTSDTAALDRRPSSSRSRSPSSSRAPARAARSPTRLGRHARPRSRGSRGRAVLFIDDLSELFGSGAARRGDGVRAQARARPRRAPAHRRHHARGVPQEPSRPTPALARRFTLVEIDEPEPRTRPFLAPPERSRSGLERAPPASRYRDEALALGRRLVACATCPGRALPDKALSDPRPRGRAPRRRARDPRHARRRGAREPAQPARRWPPRSPRWSPSSPTCPSSASSRPDGERMLSLEEILAERVVGHGERHRRASRGSSAATPRGCARAARSGRSCCSGPPAWARPRPRRRSPRRCSTRADAMTRLDSLGVRRGARGGAPRSARRPATSATRRAGSSPRRCGAGRTR